MNSPILKTLATLTVCHLLVGHAAALTPVSDDFNDNSLNLTKWVKFTDGGANLTESSVRINYTVATPELIDGDYADLTCQSFPGSSENWQVIVDITNTTTPNALEKASGSGFFIYNRENPDDLVFLEFYVSPLDPTTVTRGFFTSLITDGVDVPDSDIDTGDLSGQTAGSLRIAYNGTTKVLTTYYDTSGSGNGFQWEELSSYGLNGSGGLDGNTNWGTMPTGFEIALYCFSDAMTITSGQVTFDNFSLQSYTPALTAIQTWQIAKFASIADPDAPLDIDADKDGLKNLIEYAFKLEPKSPGTPVLITGTGTSGLPRITPIGSGPTQRLRLEYVRQKASTNPGITYTPQFSSTLLGGGWSAITGTETIQSIDTQWERVVVEDTAGTGLPNRFGRVLVTSP